MTQELTWRATHSGVQILLRQRAEREFQVVVSDGTLTYLHPVTDCDLESAQARAQDHARRFASRLPGRGQAAQARFLNLEWELVPRE